MFIRDMAERTGISEDTLRYYERIGLVPAIPRNANGMRNYGEYHVQYIMLIQRLKASGMSLDNIQEYMKLAREGMTTELLRKDMLVAAKEKLIQKIDRLQQAVSEADFQLTNYEMLLLQTNLMAQNIPENTANAAC
jgi:DNA-binding transcriptional MerR regulator